MLSTNKREALILFLGDIGIFLFALWLTLLVRYLDIPSASLWGDHIAPFAILFAVWVGVFFIAGLYEKHTLMLKSHLPGTLLKTQVLNSVLAVLFFYFIPYFGITPKTNLFIYLLFSFTLLLVWRLYGVPSFGVRNKQRALLIGTGEEMEELRDEVNGNPRYNLTFVSSIDVDELDGVDFEEDILALIYREGVSTIVIDLKNERVLPILPRLYNLIFSKVRFIDKYKVYEDIFDRVPLSLVGYNWFLENISSSSHAGYDLVKRGMDMALALSLGLVSLIVYPLVWLAIKIEDGGPVFFTQERVGKNNTPINILKFRTLPAHNDPEGIARTPFPTRTGNFLRRTRIDELPQLWNVVRGDLSLVGPRPEIPALVKQYESEIPYYNVRHLIKPGLSGWAQIYHQEHPHHGVNVKETKRKLSYDLFYIKNRSFILDLKIALKTIKILLSRAGI